LQKNLELNYSTLPFTATVNISSPFQIQSEPYTVTAQITNKQNLLPTIVVLSCVMAGVIVLGFRKRQMQ
ncbi:hypothetical protein ACFLZ8_05300, partial [Planctomycetota bacterium]